MGASAGRGQRPVSSDVDTDAACSLRAKIGCRFALSSILTRSVAFGGRDPAMDKPVYRFTLAIGAALMAAACANSETAVSEKEDMLETAGFVPKKAKTAARMASLKSLPPHQFVARTINGRPSYLYADPVVCGCV
jgi:hypothetical protein